jgi:hypothetical protein
MLQLFVFEFQGEWYTLVSYPPGSHYLSTNRQIVLNLTSGNRVNGQNYSG